MTEQHYEQAQHLCDKYKLFREHGTWIHNDTDNATARFIWATYIGEECDLKSLLGGGCKNCNKYLRIYRDIYNYVNKI